MQAHRHQRQKRAHQTMLKVIVIGGISVILIILHMTSRCIVLMPCTSMRNTLSPAPRLTPAQSLHPAPCCPCPTSELNVFKMVKEDVTKGAAVLHNFIEDSCLLSLLQAWLLWRYCGAPKRDCRSRGSTDETTEGPKNTAKHSIRLRKAGRVTGRNTATILRALAPSP